MVEDISIHAAREGGDGDPYNPKILFSISIHAAREGGDTIKCEFYIIYCISIHAAREGGDARPKRAKILHMIFQSTPPVKAAT